MADIFEYASDEEKTRIKQLLAERELKADLLSFAKAVEPSFEVYDYVRVLADALEAVERGDILNLHIAMPPRHGKSFLSSYLFPLWYLFRDSSRTIMLCSYSAAPATKFSQNVRDRIVSGKDVLSSLRVNNKISNKERWQLVDEGGIISAGVQGALTSMGCDLLIIDDPVKDHADAMSPNSRRKAYDWYTSTASTRLSPGGGQVLIQTRWHDADLAGMILNASPDEWEVISLPALALDDGTVDPLGRGPGEALCPERYDRDFLLKKRREVGEYVFSALYQQDPTPAGGSMFKRDDANFFVWVDSSTVRLGDRVLDVSELTKFVVCDVAGSVGSASDFTVIGVLAFTDRGDVLVLDIKRGKWRPAKVAKNIRQVFVDEGASFIVVEKGPISLSVIEALDDLVVKPVAAVSNKVARALPAQIMMEQGKLWFPDRERAVWMQEFENELYRFPTGAHDDQVDVLAWGVDMVKSVGFGRGEIVHSHLKDRVIDDGLHGDGFSGLRGTFF